MSEDLKQTPPESIPSDAPSEYMRGYSDGLAQAEETIAAAIQRARYEAIEVCAKLCDLHQKMREATGHPREASSARKLAAAMRSAYENAR
jgi:hypothetical protein